MSFIRNKWYMAVWSHEIAPGPGGMKPVGRKILGEDIVFYRDSKMQAVALADMCPHRFAPLSYGNISGDNIKCRYHGLEFGSDGKCAVDPSGAKAPLMAVKKYHVEERDGMIYVWIGDEAPSEPAPDWLAWEDGFGAVLRGTVEVGANYRLMVDNLMDDAHATHLHELLASDGHIARPETSIEKLGDKVRVTNDINNTNLAPFFAPMRRKPGNVDQRVTITWNPVSAIRIKSTVRDVGADISEEVGVDSAHVLTPETETSCHYFYSFARNANKEDHLFTQKMNGALAHIFKTEDAWITEAQQRFIGDKDFWDMKPALMPQDKAAVMVRRELDKMIAGESAKVAAE